MLWGLIPAGAAVAAFGLLFHMQGRGMVGPEQSFMHNSPDWFGYGVWMLVAGVVVAGTGAFLHHSGR